MRNEEIIDVYDEAEPVHDPKKLGIEVRRQGRGTSTKDLVFDPVTGEFVIGGDGIRAGGDVVTQMTEDGFAATDYDAGYRYNEATGEFESPPPNRNRTQQFSQQSSSPQVRPIPEGRRGDYCILAGGIVSTFISGWIGGALIALGIARRMNII